MSSKTVEATLSTGAVVDLTVPEDYNNEQIARVVRSVEARITGNTPGAAQEDDSYSGLGSALMGGTAGVTLDWGDEIGAGLSTGFGLLGDYDAAKERLEAEFEQARSDNPKSYMAGEVGSMLVPGFGLAKAATAVPKVARAASRMNGLGKAATLGAAEGLISSAGRNDLDEGVTAREYVGQLAVDAGLGGLMGGAAKKALDAGSVVLRGAGSAVNNAFPSQAVRGERAVRRSLESDDLTDVESVRARGAELGDEAMVADLGPNSRSSLGENAKPQGPGRKMAEERLLERNDGAIERVQDTTINELGDGNFRTLDEIRQAQETALKAQARPLYKRAYERVITQTPTMEKLRGTDLFNRAEAKARASIKNDLDGDIGIDPDDMSGMFTTRVAHRILRELDNQIEQVKPSQFKRGDSVKYGQLQNLKASFRREVFDQNPDFAEAQRLWAGGAASREALDAGRSALKGRDRSTEDVLGEFDGLGSEGERENFRSGVMDLIYARLDNVVDSSRGEATSVANKGLPTNRDQRVVMEVFNDGEALVEKLGQEAEYRKTYDSALQGSQTFENGVNRSESAPGGLGELLSGWVRQVAGRVFSRELGNEGRAAAVEKLTTRITDMSDDDVLRLIRGNNLGTTLTSILGKAPGADIARQVVTKPNAAAAIGVGITGEPMDEGGMLSDLTVDVGLPSISVTAPNLSVEMPNYDDY